MKIILNSVKKNFSLNKTENRTEDFIDFYKSRNFLLFQISNKPLKIIIFYYEFE